MGGFESGVVSVWGRWGAVFKQVASPPPPNKNSARCASGVGTVVTKSCFDAVRQKVCSTAHDEKSLLQLVSPDHQQVSDNKRI